MKVCLDTNVLVAAFATRGLCADVFRAVVTERELVLGEVIAGELRRVLRSKLRLPEEVLRSVDGVLASFPVLPKPPSPVRDASDRWIVATAVAGGADVLVTGDHDLLAVRDTAPVEILDPRAFWERLRSG